jgi:hypothetical protein
MIHHNDEAPKPGRAKGLQNSQQIRQAKFTGTDNPRHLRVIDALLRRPRRREDIDRIAGCSNGPDLIAELRRRGLGEEHLPCKRIRFIDRDGQPCHPGVYSLTEPGRRAIYAWFAKCRKGGAHA